MTKITSILILCKIIVKIVEYKPDDISAIISEAN